MIHDNLYALLLQVLQSWEVIAVTVVLILYFFLVFYVARLYRRPKSFNPLSRARKASKKKTVEVVPEPDTDEDDDDAFLD